MTSYHYKNYERKHEPTKWQIQVIEISKEPLIISNILCYLKFLQYVRNENTSNKYFQFNLKLDFTFFQATQSDMEDFLDDDEDDQVFNRTYLNLTFTNLA